MKAGEPPSFCNTATYWADRMGAGGALASTIWLRARGRMLSGSRSGLESPTPITATRVAAIAEVMVARLRHRLALAERRRTLGSPAAGAALSIEGGTGVAGSAG